MVVQLEQAVVQPDQAQRAEPAVFEATACNVNKSPKYRNTPGTN